ncbi:MAG: hypothetical protein ACJ75B_07345 [Flavisolibacter sp.]
MKKLLLITVLMFGIHAFGFAQTKGKQATKTDQTTTRKVTAPKKTQTATVSSTTATTAGSSVKTKKDGTPDMRYKENKEAAKTKTTAHVKKDGTPDKRYKENKNKG